MQPRFALVSGMSTEYACTAGCRQGQLALRMCSACRSAVLNRARGRSAGVYTSVMFMRGWIDAYIAKWGEAPPGAPPPAPPKPAAAAQPAAAAVQSFEGKAEEGAGAQLTPQAEAGPADPCACSPGTPPHKAPCVSKSARHLCPVPCMHSSGCTCSCRLSPLPSAPVDGTSGGTQTGRLGCSQFNLDKGDQGYLCMAVGGTLCPQASPSPLFPGSAQLPCTPDAATAGGASGAAGLPARSGPQAARSLPGAPSDQGPCTCSADGLSGGVDTGKRCVGCCS